MKETMTRDPARVDAALAQLAGEYRAAAAARNMLVVVGALIVPLLMLIVVRLLDNVLPAVAAMVAGGLVGLGLFCLLVDFVAGALRFDAGHVARYSPWFWWNWHIARDKIAALGVLRGKQGSHLVIETADGRRRRLPFRPGFERVLSVID